MISYLYIVTIIIDIRVGLFLLHGLESLLVLGLHLLRLLSGPDLHLQLLPLLLLGELHLVLGLLGLPEHILGLVHCLLGSAYHDGLIFSEDGAAY